MKAGRRKSASGSIGSATRRSTARKAASRSAAPANSDTIRVLPHPSALPRTSASTSASSAVLNVATPAQSMRVACGSRLSRSLSRVMAIAATPIGTLR